MGENVNTDVLAYSDIHGTREKCHCNTALPAEVKKTHKNLTEF